MNLGVLDAPTSVLDSTLEGVALQVIHPRFRGSVCRTERRELFGIT